MIAEFTPKGWLNERLVATLQREIQQSLKGDCTALLISGSTLRYRGPEGLAALVAALESVQGTHPALPLWLCHLAPTLLEAIQLAAIGERWHIVPDRATALAVLTIQDQEMRYAA